MMAKQQATDNMTAAAAMPLSPPGGTEYCPYGKVRIGVFFDGTGNNKYVDSPDPYGSGGKGNAYSNVAFLYDAYQGTEGGAVLRKIYHHGVGTDSDAPPGVGTNEQYPDWQGLAFGAGGKARVQWAVEQLGEFFTLNELAPEKLFDTYGFSRGAAIARDFVNTVRTDQIPNYNKPVGWEAAITYPIAGGPPVPALVRTYEKHAGVTAMFLGVFDTVASFGTLGDDTGNILSGYDFFIDHTYVQRTVHMVAEDETRMNFPVTSLFMEPSVWGLDPWPPPIQNPNDYSASMIEIWYPGAHSDVGGGYMVDPGTPPVPAHWVTVYDGFGVPDQVWIPETPGTPPRLPDLSKIPLLDMCTESIDAGVPITMVDAVVPGDLSQWYGEYVGYRAPTRYAIGKQYIHTFASLVFEDYYYGQRAAQPSIVNLKAKYIHDSRWPLDKLVYHQQRSMHFVGPQP